MKKGFTLVELSIVLVIIGLLAGGILAGRSMIETTKIQSFLRMVQQSDIAISNYQLMYNGLPGDSNSAIGNRNGVIEDDGAWKGPRYIVKYNNEAAQFWPDLSAIGYDPKSKYVVSNTGKFNANAQTLNAPITPFGAKATIIPSSWDGDLIYNWYRVVNLTQFDNAGDRSVYPAYSQLDGTYTGDLNAVSPVIVQSVCNKIGDGSMAENLANNNASVTDGKVVFGIHYPEWDQGCDIKIHKNTGCNIYLRMLSQVGQATR